MSKSPDRATKWAIPFLLFGGFLLGVGWFVGLVLLWGSRAWTLGEKLLGTFVIPFGLAGSLWFASILAGGTSQTGGCALPVHTLARCVVATKTSKASVLEIVVGIVILIAPVLTAWYLYRQTRDRLGAAPAVP